MKKEGRDGWGCDSGPPSLGSTWAPSSPPTCLGQGASGTARLWDSVLPKLRQD